MNIKVGAGGGGGGDLHIHMLISILKQLYDITDRENMYDTT